VVACEQGYLCEVCGKDVESITDSDLYLRYIMGEVSPLELPTMRERHIRCNPALAQYIVHEAFEPVKCEGGFARENLDADYAADQEKLVTRAWLRLQEVARMGVPITEYPLPEVQAAWGKRSEPQG
jgi:hypothetical protein